MENELVANIVEAGFRDWFVIKNVFIKLQSGDVLLITGRSGSGKSTLLKTLAGLIDKIGGFLIGTVSINNVDVYNADPERIPHLLSYIPQEPWYGVVGHTVRSELCHSLSIRDLECVDEIFSKYGLRGFEDRVTYGLSAGQIQRLLLAEALESRTSILLLDEPFTYVDHDTRKTILREVEKFSSEGGIVVVVDHLPHNWIGFEPKTIYLERGRILENVSRIYDIEEKTNLKIHRAKTGKSEALLKAENVWFKYSSSSPVLKGASIEANGGEITGLVGPNGSGKSTLLKILAGIYKPYKGKVYRQGKATYIPENPLLYLTHPTPREELYYASKDENAVNEVIEIFALRDILDKPVLKISSGERRRVAIASSYLHGYSVYLLDEPTGGLDIHSLEGFVEMISFLRERGSAVLIAHHDPRLRDVVDKEYSMVDGVVDRTFG